MNNRCIVKTDKMSIEWKTRDDLILPRSEWRHNQYQNQRWHSNNQRMTTSQRNTQYVTIETHFIINPFLSTHFFVNNLFKVNRQSSCEVQR